MQWLFLALATVHVVTLTNAQTASVKNEGIEHHDYLECTTQTEVNPGVCDCRGVTKCFIKFTITKNKNRTDDGTNDQTQLFSVNGGRIGPTIIVDHNQLIIVDVYNEIIDTEHPENANISIHWHGMHQWNTGWMDGVGNITQWPTKPRDAFRYVLRANPAGTHWYHSHMLYQRDEGIVGALIVRDIPSENTKELLKNVTDDPGKTMLAIRDHVVEANNLEGTFPRKSSECEPDHSKFPIFRELLGGGRAKIKQFRVNGVELSGLINETRKGPTFYVERGTSYRFRIVGVMTANVIRFSIDKHKLQVISADGYLTEPSEIDILIVHVGERYDFILETNGDYDAETVFPIRIETVAVQCDDYFTPSKIGYAYLQYTDNEIHGEPNLVDHYGSNHRCKVEECIALNCPFAEYPLQANTICNNVKELQLLNPTSEDELPFNKYPLIERFFNFGFNRLGPVINGIKNILPQNIPFVHSGNEEVQNECAYKHTNTCKTCSHSVYLPKSRGNSRRFEPQVVRFVLSSLSAKKPGDRVANVVTHPVHLHGHSYFVAKIGYPTYHENGTISNLNTDVAVKSCGHGHWKNGEPSGINVDSSTVRKDVIIVPAGGYVVIEFLAVNPGWWFMHCHIDPHLNGGMAIAVSELPECQNPPENVNYTVEDTYEDSESRFHQYEKSGDKCGINKRKNMIKPNTPTTKKTEAISAEKQAREMETLSDKITGNLRQKIFNPVAIDNHDYEHVSPYYKRSFERVGARADTEQRKFQDRKRDEYASEWDAINLARDEQI